MWCDLVVSEKVVVWKCIEWKTDCQHFEWMGKGERERDGNVASKSLGFGDFSQNIYIYVYRYIIMCLY